MRVVVLGAGGVGSVVAGYLARAGHEAVMLAREGHVRAVRNSGLHIKGLNSFRVSLPAFTEASGLKDADLLLVTVKAKDTESALSGVGHLRVGCVVSLQNGVLKNELLGKTFGWNKVVGATTMIGASLIKDGVIEHTLDGITFLGELDGTPSARVNQIVDAFVDAGLKAAVVDNIKSIEWTKQALQNPFAALAAITRLPLEQIWVNPQLSELSVHMFREVAGVAQASGATLSDHPEWSLFNLKALRDAPFHEAVQKLIQLGDEAIASDRKSIIPSMLQDVLAGKQTEVESTIGNVVREGRRLGVPVPYTEFAYGIVKTIQENYNRTLK